MITIKLHKEFIKLTVVLPDGSRTEHSFDDNQVNEPVSVEIGSIMQWTTETDLTFSEVCYPAYEDGRFEDIG